MQVQPLLSIYIYPNGPAMTAVDTGTPERRTQVFINIGFCYWSRPFPEVFLSLVLGSIVGPG